MTGSFKFNEVFGHGMLLRGCRMRSDTRTCRQRVTCQLLQRIRCWGEDTGKKIIRSSFSKTRFIIMTQPHSPVKSWRKWSIMALATDFIGWLIYTCEVVILSSSDKKAERRFCKCIGGSFQNLSFFFNDLVLINERCWLCDGKEGHA